MCQIRWNHVKKRIRFDIYLAFVSNQLKSCQKVIKFNNYLSYLCVQGILSKEYKPQKEFYLIDVQTFVRLSNQSARPRFEWMSKKWFSHLLSHPCALIKSSWNVKRKCSVIFYSCDPCKYITKLPNHMNTHITHFGRKVSKIHVKKLLNHLFFVTHPWIGRKIK